MESNQLEGLDRLMDAATILEGVPDDKWDMGWWVHELDCGTAGCAAYHYADARPDSGLCIDGGQPRYRGFYGWDALEQYFRLTENECYSIFDEDCYDFFLEHPVSRQQVIDRIREFVAQKKRELEAACQDI